MARALLRRAYDPEQVAAYLRRAYAGRVTFHDGADEIAPGLSIHAAGGHTPGMQVVRVNARRGQVVLTSDAVHFYENLDAENPFPVLVSTIDYVETLHRLRDWPMAPTTWCRGTTRWFSRAIRRLGLSWRAWSPASTSTRRSLRIRSRVKVRAAILWEQGHQPHENGPLVVEEVDLDGPGPGELLVRITAAGLCHSDLSAITGDRPRTMPAVIGHEAAGVVEEVGAGVDGLAVGDQVVMVFVASCGQCEFCGSGRPNLCQSSWSARSAGTLQTGSRRLRSTAGRCTTTAGSPPSPSGRWWCRVRSCGSIRTCRRRWPRSSAAR